MSLGVILTETVAFVFVILGILWAWVFHQSTHRTNHSLHLISMELPLSSLELCGEPSAPQINPSSSALHVISEYVLVWLMFCIYLVVCVRICRSLELCMSCSRQHPRILYSNTLLWVITTPETHSPSLPPRSYPHDNVRRFVYTCNASYDFPGLLTGSAQNLCTERFGFRAECYKAALHHGSRRCVEMWQFGRNGSACRS